MAEQTNGQHPAAGSKQYRWIIFVTGPTACGKTTIARYIAEQINARFLEGDDVS
jgi:gluconokinase